MVRVLVAPVILFVLQALTASVLLPPMPAPSGGAAFLASSIAISAWTLIALASTLRSKGWRRTAVLFLVAAGIPTINLIEGVFFSLDIPRSHIVPLILHAIACSA